MSGKVYLVGAGPGDPELLTLKGARVLSLADVVFYDRLIHSDILLHTKRGARLHYVGKECLCTHGAKRGTSVSQAEIHRLLIKYALDNKTVVRLKGGDPFVFGRGGEEIEALAKLGIEYEIVSGVSSLAAVPASVGIPVTSRGVSSSFSVYTAHGADRDSNCPIDWEHAAKSETGIFFMGSSRATEIALHLIENGRNFDTPVAIIERGTLEQQHLTIMTLGELANTKQCFESPALIVVGEVVRYAETISKIASQFSSESKYAYSNAV